MQEGPEYKVSLGYLVILGYRRPCFRKREKQKHAPGLLLQGSQAASSYSADLWVSTQV